MFLYFRQRTVIILGPYINKGTFVILISLSLEMTAFSLLKVHSLPNTLYCHFHYIFALYLKRKRDTLTFKLPYRLHLLLCTLRPLNKWKEETIEYRVPITTPPHLSKTWIATHKIIFYFQSCWLNILFVCVGQVKGAFTSKIGIIISHTHVLLNLHVYVAFLILPFLLPENLSTPRVTL
jgi:hypothetical protein